MAKPPGPKRWVIRAGPSFYVAQDGTETTRKQLSANFPTPEEAISFAINMDITMDGVLHYYEHEEFQPDEVRG